MTRSRNETSFPELPLEKWRSTKDTLHLYAQIVGKIRLAMHPRLNHWWHVPLYVSPRGLTTRPIPFGRGNFEIVFDFIDHRLEITASTGEKRRFELEEGLTVADFYKNVFENLGALSITPTIRAVPYEAPSKTPFAEETEFHSYDKEYIEKFHRILITVNDIFEEFRGRFTGKSTPVHMFWHSFDLALTRFSGRPGNVREDAGTVEREAYSQEVISFGFWPGDDNIPAPAFYSYTAPEPAGLTEEPIKPEAAKWNTDKGAMALLMYDDVRNSENPRESILQFLDSTYLAGAKCANWNVSDLELKPLV